MFFKSHPCVFLCPWMFGTRFQNFLLSHNGSEQNFECFSLLQYRSERKSEYFYHLQSGSEGNNKILSVFLFYQIVQSRIPSIFIFRKIVLNEITKFRVFRKWLGTKFRAFLSSAEWLGTEFWAFSVPRNRRNFDRMNQNFRLFRVPRIIFFSENGNAGWEPNRWDGLLILKQCLTQWQIFIPSLAQATTIGDNLFCETFTLTYLSDGILC
jgi:hypothetical protein